jgi:hypothetical protein
MTDTTTTEPQGEAVKGAAPNIDIAAIMAQMDAYQQQQEATNRALRDDMLALLRNVGVDTVTAHYDAYGDSGNIEELVLLPEILAPTVAPEGAPQLAGAAAPDGDMEHPIEAGDPRLTAAQREQLCDLLWNIVYGLHPGFENNDGGFGDIEWDIAADSITIEHNERFTDYNSYSHEGV